MSIYIIVENVPAVESSGVYEIEQVIVPSLGYFDDETIDKCEAKVFCLNEEAVNNHPHQEQYVDRFSYVSVSENKETQQEYLVETYELHSCKIMVQADSPTEAVKKIRDGEGDAIENGMDYIETADSYGMSEDQMVEAGIDPYLETCGFLQGIRSVEPYDGSL